MSEDTITRATPPRPPASPVAALLVAGALCLPACGGASPATDDGGDAAADDGGEDTTTGGEVAGAASAERGTEAEGAADADGETVGAETADGPAADGETADDGEAADADAADEDAAEAESAEEAAPDPRVVWRTKVRRGRRVFERVCGVCHPGGEEDLGPSILGANLSVSEVRRQIRQGVGRMRPIPPSKLPERYMDELFAYLSTLRVVRGVPRP